MCQACMPPTSQPIEPSNQQSDGTVAIPYNEISLPKFVALVVFGFAGSLTLIGAVIWLAVWLQSQMQMG